MSKEGHNSKAFKDGDYSSYENYKEDNDVKHEWIWVVADILILCLIAWIIFK